MNSLPELNTKGQKLTFERIFSVKKLSNGKLRWREECDGWFEEELSPEESLQLLETIKNFIA